MILVVDDEELLREIVQDYLRDNYQTLEASSGHEALDMFQSNPVRLVVSDVRMPNMSGITLYQELRKIQPDVKVIFMTGHCSDEQKEQMALYNVTCLKKPFRAKELLNAIEKELHSP